MNIFEIDFSKTEGLYNKVGPQSFRIMVVEDIGKLQGISCCVPKDVMRRAQELRQDEQALFYADYVNEHFDSLVPFPTMGVFLKSQESK